jgi:hypothetical protein
VLPLPAAATPLAPPFPQLVFTEVALGAVILTINVILLGGSIVFFQSLCLIGYCLFPIVIAAIVCTLVSLSVSGYAQRAHTVQGAGAWRPHQAADVV